MDSLAPVVSLARALLSLWRGERSGVLSVRTEFGSMRCALERGQLRAASPLPCVDAALGDALLDAGALDAAAHRARLDAHGHDDEPIGAWLLRSGLTTRGALETSLRRQLRDRVLAAFACRSIDYRFEPEARDPGLRMIDEPMAIVDLVLCALRTRAELDSVQASLTSGELLRLNALGRKLARSAALWPSEAALAAMLRTGATPVELAPLLIEPRARRFVALLRLLSALTADRNSRFTLLLQKRAQLRHGASAHALLELERDASAADARRALRRLAAQLHPDAFGPDVPAQLRDASGEVMSGLIAAECELRARARIRV